jgi:hypothetical protein
MKNILFYLVFIPVFTFLSGEVGAETYLSQEAFLGKYFDTVPEVKILWISSDLRKDLKKELNENLPVARLRYWQQAEQSAWVLDKIGRDKPITMGFVIKNNEIFAMEVLAFRESRGYEVRYPRFTQKLKGVSLSDDAELNKHIDNITGATLSVNAVKKTARLALYLNALVEEKTSLEEVQ